MLRLLKTLIDTGCKTQKNEFGDLPDYASGLPGVDSKVKCQDECKACVDVCPTNAIEIFEFKSESPKMQLDLGACISCNLCIETCPSAVLKRSFSTRTACTSRDQLILGKEDLKNDQESKAKDIFKRSFAVRVVSTGCSACDLEIGAAFNPIFDASRFGINFVASPRAADALLVTGPCPKGMHEALMRTYESMSSPKLVIACGSCAISGGMHKHGYAEANGLDSILPVDVYIPGCPPHPWSIIHGLQKAMNL